jgi:hypothetical protein
VDDLAQDQAQPNRTGRNFRLRPGVAEAAGQQLQVKALVRVMDELAQLIEVGAIHFGGARRDGAVRR